MKINLSMNSRSPLMLSRMFEYTHRFSEPVTWLFGAEYIITRNDITRVSKAINLHGV